MNNNILTSLRLKSLIMDLIIIFIIIIPFIIPLFFGLNNITYYTFVLSLLFTFFLCKDLINFKYMGKHKYNLKIVDINHKKLSPLKLVLRNIFIIIWPLEFVMYFINPERRLGDIIFSTKVICKKSSEDDNENIIKKGNYVIFLLIFLLLFGIIYFTIKSLHSLDNIIKLFYG